MFSWPCISINLCKECIKLVFLYTNSWSSFLLEELIVCWLVDKLCTFYQILSFTMFAKYKMPNVFRTKGACCHAVIHFNTCLCHLWKPFSLLLFIASEFCFVWLCNEVFVKWSVVWSKIPLQFHMSGYRLVTLAWDHYKIYLFCTVGNEADLYDSYESACVMSLWCWLKTIWSCVFYDAGAICTAHINTLPSGHEKTRKCSPMRCWCVTSFVVFLRTILHTSLSAGLAHLSLQVFRQLNAGLWVSSYTETDRSWPPIFRTRRL